jgi:apolipoprotein N-acyltransferase
LAEEIGLKKESNCESTGPLSETSMELIFLPFNVFLVFPPLAIIIGLVFFAIARGQEGKRGSTKAAATLWTLYGAYECYMSWIWSPAHIAPIRADLLLFAPVLYLATFFALFSVLSCQNSGNKSSGS